METCLLQELQQGMTQMQRKKATNEYLTSEKTMENKN